MKISRYYINSFKIALITISLLIGVDKTYAKDYTLFNAGWQFALGPTTVSGQKADYPDSEKITKEYTTVTLPHNWTDKPVERMDKDDRINKEYYKAVDYQSRTDYSYEK
ncbi:hypothetical protein [Polaribacter staleyi]|uniref:hypothetical protein n=1 Tax=Polaribacter staleyi TaxID=2022337 RepID=UPI0031BB9526